MDHLNRRGSVVTLTSEMINTQLPSWGLPPCKQSPNENPGRTRLKTRRNQRRKSLVKDLDQTGDLMVHGNSTKWKNIAHQNDEYNNRLIKKMHKQGSISKHTAFPLHRAAICKDVPTKICGVLALTQTTAANSNFYRINCNPGWNRIKRKKNNKREEHIRERNKTFSWAGF